MWIHLNKSVKVHLKFPATKVPDNRGRALLLTKNGRGEVRVVDPCWRNAACTKKRNKKMPLCVDGWDSSENEKGREKQREGGEEDCCVKLNIMSEFLLMKS